ncbi:MAG: hypothetical protein IT430_07675 [Phycisphaerales bacterium]|nr:hypothetical protein [Phycisphaerales bacterium]
MPEPLQQDEQLEHIDIPAHAFRTLVESVGVKRFASGMGLSTRQVNRILSGAQPNPIDRLIKSLSCCDPDVGDRILDLICQEMGGYFIREETIDAASINAVRECAEAIAAISDGHISKMDELVIREAVAALTSLAQLVRRQKIRRITVITE